MGNFDLTPLVKSGGYKVIYRLFVWSVPLVLLLFTFGNHDFAVSFFIALRFFKGFEYIFEMEQKIILDTSA